MTKKYHTSSAFPFKNALPPSRLGKAHGSLDAFRAAQKTMPQKSKEYTLIVVTETYNKKILLGMKNRGFGTGMYNSFGGKFDSPTESVEQCACRELHEETNISIPLEDMKQRKVGIQRFSFEDSDTEMVVHLFHVHINPDKHSIKGCDEITPRWFDNWYDIPLDNMFADDSLWLTRLLGSETPLAINGWYHFRQGGQEVNTILHHYLDVKEKGKFTIEQRLFHEIHNNSIRSPSVKEFKEAFSFSNAVRGCFGKQGRDFDVIVDVAGGHGALGAIFLITTSAKEAIIIDPADVGNGNVQKAWGKYMTGKQLKYRYECLRSGLPDELNRIINHDKVSPDRVLVVACHACPHLSQETLEIATQFGCNAAAMPCCQKDRSGGSWKSASKNIGVPIEKVMDLLLAGKMMALPNYDVRMKCIDSKITPQNRVIVCRSLYSDEEKSREQSKRDKAHEQLERTYKKAHSLSSKEKPKRFLSTSPPQIGLYLSLAFAGGVLSGMAFQKRPVG